MFPTALSAAVWTEDTQTLLDNDCVVFNMYKWYYFYLNFDLLVAEQWNKEGDDTWVYYHLNLFVTSICQIRQSPHCVYQNLEEAGFSV